MSQDLIGTTKGVMPGDFSKTRGGPAQEEITIKASAIVGFEEVFPANLAQNVPLPANVVTKEKDPERHNYIAPRDFSPL